VFKTVSPPKRPNTKQDERHTGVTQPEP
jgi:hypothetical protein